MAASYDEQGQPAHLPKRDRGQGNRITRGMVEGFGEQPLAGISERDRANYPTLAGYLDPVAKSLNYVSRLPGAVAGGLAGTVGAGTEYLTSDPGYANYNQRQARALLDYLAIRGMAEPGMVPSAAIPKNGEVLAPTRAAPAQLGYVERAPVDVYRELPPGSIRGTSAEGAPRLAAPNPLSQYRQTANFDYGIGPQRPSEAYRPVVDQTYTLPQELNRRPEVVTEPSAASRLGSESPQADQALAMAQQRVRDAEARFLAEQQARATGEGMRERPGTDFNLVGSSYDPTGRALQPVYTGRNAVGPDTPRSFLQPSSNLPAVVDRGAGVPSPIQGRALALTEQPAASGVAPRQLGNVWEGQFTEVQPNLAISGPSSPAIAGSNIPRLAAGEIPAAADVAAGPGAFSAMPMRPITAGGTVGAAMLTRAIQQAPGEANEPQPTPPQPATPPPPPKVAALPPAAQQAVQTARARAIPLPPSRELQAQARAAQPSSGGLASLFNRPLSTKELYQQSFDNPDDTGAWMRAERQYASTHKDNPNFNLTKLDPDTGMKRGGTASGKSEKMPDPVHKALEIIHHLLMRH